MTEEQSVGIIGYGEVGRSLAIAFVAHAASWATTGNPAAGYLAHF